MTNSKSQDLEFRSDDGNLSTFFATQMLTNMQKQIVALESLDRKLFVLIKKTEELVHKNQPEYDVVEDT